MTNVILRQHKREVYVSIESQYMRHIKATSKRALLGHIKSQSIKVNTRQTEGTLLVTNVLTKCIGWDIY